jgi:hypothetical protein
VWVREVGVCNRHMLEKMRGIVQCKCRAGQGDVVAGVQGEARCVMVRVVDDVASKRADDDTRSLQ